MTSTGSFSLRRVLILCQNDLWHSLSGRKGLFFLIPYALFWYLILNKLAAGAAAWLQQPAGLTMAGWMFSPEMAMSLFRNHPPTLSAFYLVALFVLPGFCMLAGCNQLAGDAGRGYFRFLLSRCTRTEIFFGRMLTPFLLTGLATLIAGILSTWIALQTDNHETAEIIAYALHINLILLLYILTLLSLMTLLSARFKSAGATLFSAFMLVVLVKTGSFILKSQWPELTVLDYLLPGHVAGLLVNPEPGMELLGLGLLPIYVLSYGSLAWLLFSRRSL